MISTEERREFLRVFYRLTNQQAPDNLVDVDAVEREYGLEAGRGEAMARVLADDGYLEPKGPFPDYRLTPKGWLEVRATLGKPDAQGHITPRLTLQASPLGASQGEIDVAAIAAQKIGTQDREAVRSMLDLVNERLASLDSPEGLPVAQVQEVIQELETELRQAAPNVLRLKGLLLGLALACQTGGGDEQIGHDVKVALSFSGIDML